MCVLRTVADAILKEEGAGQPSLVTLPHPKEGGGALYLLVPQSSQVFEVCRFSDEPQCWFAEDTLIKGTLPRGQLPLTPNALLPLDPLFLQTAVCSSAPPWTPCSWPCPTSSEPLRYAPTSHGTCQCFGSTEPGPLPREGALHPWRTSLRTMPFQRSGCCTASSQANSGTTSAAQKAGPHCHLPSLV